jgi:hypothetical protein
MKIQHRTSLLDWWFGYYAFTLRRRPLLYFLPQIAFAAVLTFASQRPNFPCFGGMELKSRFLIFLAFILLIFPMALFATLSGFVTPPGKEEHVGIEDRGLLFYSAQGEQELVPWSEVRPPIQTRRVLVLLHGRSNFHPIPRTYFPGRAAECAFLAELQLRRTTAAQSAGA